MKKEKLTFISYSYAIGALLVIIGHSMVNSAEGFTLFYDNIRTFIYFIHMPMFFFVAGVLLSYTKRDNREPYISFMKKKTIRFFVPFIILTLIGYGVMNIFSSDVSQTFSINLSITNFLRTLIYTRDSIWGHFWFIMSLFIIHSFGYVFLNALKSGICKIVITAVLLLAAIYPVESKFLTINDICKCAVYYWSGILCEDLLIKYQDKILKLRYGIITFAISVAVYTPFIDMYWKVNPGEDIFLWQRLYCIVNIFTAFMCLYAILCLSKWLEKKKITFLDFFEGKTFTIYLLSWPIQSLAIFLMAALGIYINWFIVFAILFVAGLGVPLIVIAMFNRFKSVCKYKRLTKAVKLIIGM